MLRGRREREGEKLRGAEKMCILKERERPCLDDGVFGFWLSISISCASLSFAQINSLGFEVNYLFCPAPPTGSSVLFCLGFLRYTYSLLLRV